MGPAESRPLPSHTRILHVIACGQGIDQLPPIARGLAPGQGFVIDHACLATSPTRSARTNPHLEDGCSVPLDSLDNHPGRHRRTSRYGE